MELIGIGFLYVFILGMAFAGFIWAFKAFGFLKIYFWNRARIKILEDKRMVVGGDAKEKVACRIVLERCEPLKSRWLLEENDFLVYDHTLKMFEDIARTYHSESTMPILEARLESVLQAFQELNRRILRLMRLRGFRTVTQFRLRHLVFLGRVWEKKKNWESTAAAQWFKRTRFVFLFRWGYTFFRFLDISFWFSKMGIYVFYDLFFKTLLVHWYLLVGELAVCVYREEKKEMEEEGDILFEDLELLSDLEESLLEEFPSGIKDIIKSSRDQILFQWKVLEWEKVQENYAQLVVEIARFHEPQSDDPLYEAKLYKILESLAKLSEKTADLESLPVIGRLLRFRISKVLWMKEKIDYFQDHQVMDLAKKYHLVKVSKYASLLFKIVQKRHPAVLFKDFAWMLSKEAFKRWITLHFHRKIAQEAHIIYFSN